MFFATFHNFCYKNFTKKEIKILEHYNKIKKELIYLIKNKANTKNIKFLYVSQFPPTTQYIYFCYLYNYTLKEPQMR